MYTKGMQKVEVTHKTIIFTIMFLLVLKFLWIVKDLLFSLFIAFIIMSALRPFVNFLAKKRFPRGLAALLVYVVFLAFFLQILTLAVPPLVVESAHFLRNLPEIVQSVSPNFSLLINLDSLTAYLPDITSKFFSLAKGIFSNAVFTISTLFFAFYFLVEEDIIKKFVGRFFDTDLSRKVINVFEKAEKRMSAWFWGELVLMTIVGLMTFIGLNLIGIRYVLPLAVLAGLLEAVPNLGPVLSAIPAVVVGLSSSYFLGFSTLALYFIVQQLENNLIVPLIMKKAVGLNPIATLMALIVGGKIGGVLGILLAIPLMLFLETILLELTKSTKPSFAKASESKSAENLR